MHWHMQRAGSGGCGAIVGKRRGTNNQRGRNGNAQPRDKDADSNCVFRRPEIGQHDRRFNSVWRVGFFQGVRDKRPTPSRSNVCVTVCTVIEYERLFCTSSIRQFAFQSRQVSRQTPRYQMQLQAFPSSFGRLWYQHTEART